MRRQLTVDFKRVVGDDLIRGQRVAVLHPERFSRSARPSSSAATIGESCGAEVVEYDEATGALVLKVLAQLEPEDAGAR